MKRIAILALLAGALTVGSNGAQAQDATAELTVVHAATYDAGDSFPVTVCLDGGLVDGNFQVGEQIVADLPAGTYTADIYVGADVFAGPDCAEDEMMPSAAPEPALSGPITLAAGDAVTVVAAWNAEGPGLLEFDTDTSCVDEGTANVTAIHAATAGTVDVWAGPAGGDLAPLVPEFAEGEVAGPVNIPAGAYDIAVFPAGADPSGTPAIAVDGLEVEAGTSVTIYAIGGNDGDLGAFALVDDAPICAGEPVGPPAEEPIAEEAPPATPVAGQPTFTG
jgi:hypothetical protein